MDPNRLTLGIEEEFFIVDGASGELVPRSDELVDAARDELGPCVTRELNKCQIETATPVCRDGEQALSEVHRLRAGLAAAASPLGLGVAAVGTHPFSSWEDQQIVDGERRYDRMGRRYQAVARQQIICGCHVHVGVPDPEVAIEVMNRSRAWLSPLLALSGNSPFWHGVDTGFDSYRTEVWQRWPTAGMPPTLEDREDFEDRVDELSAIGAVDDATNLYWYVRPSVRWPTVEFRPCDVCLYAEDSVALALLIRALVWTAESEAARGAPMLERSREAADAAMWRAARYGLSGHLVDAYEDRVQPAVEVVDQLLDHVDQGLRAHGDREFVRDQVARIIDGGNGARWQRRRLEALGGASDELVGRLVDETARTP